jgi:hypothetical protein
MAKNNYILITHTNNGRADRDFGTYFDTLTITGYWYTENNPADVVILMPKCLSQSILRIPITFYRNKITRCIIPTEKSTLFCFQKKYIKKSQCTRV